MNPLSIAWLAPVVLAWNWIRSSFTRVSSYLFVNSMVGGAVADHLHVMLWKEWKVIPMGTRIYPTYWFGLKSLGCDGPVVLESFTGGCLFRQGWKVVFWQPSGDHSGTLRTFRGNVNVQSLLSEAAARLYKVHEGNVARGEFACKTRGSGFQISRFYGSSGKSPDGRQGRQVSDPTDASAPKAGMPVANDNGVYPSSLGTTVCPAYEMYPVIGRSVDDFGQSSRQPALTKHYIDPELAVVSRELEVWIAAASWMRDRGIAHRRGVLLHGVGGTGKSSLVRALAQHYELPLVVVELATVSDFDLPKLRAQLRDLTIVLFEDIDNIFEGRQNVVDHDGAKLTFDAFINLLSGVESIECFVVATTNHIEKLDPVLIRPGRFDRKVEVPFLTAKGRQQISARILDGCPEELRQSVLENQTDGPAAAFENVCIQEAMNWYWNHHLKAQSNDS